jgi:hypothetical protein
MARGHNTDSLQDFLMLLESTWELLAPLVSSFLRKFLISKKDQKNLFFCPLSKIRKKNFCFLQHLEERFIANLI